MATTDLTSINPATIAKSELSLIALALVEGLSVAAPIKSGSVALRPVLRTASL